MPLPPEAAWATVNIPGRQVLSLRAVPAYLNWQVSDYYFITDCLILDLDSFWLVSFARLSNF